MLAGRDVSRLVWLTFLVGAVIIVPFFVYRFTYVEWRSEYLKGRKFRSLDEARSQLVSRLENLGPLFQFSEVNELGDLAMLRAELAEAKRKAGNDRARLVLAERLHLGGALDRRRADYRKAREDVEGHARGVDLAQQSMNAASDRLERLKAELREEREGSAGSAAPRPAPGAVPRGERQLVVDAPCGDLSSTACLVEEQERVVEELAAVFVARVEGFLKGAHSLHDSAQSYRLMRARLEALQAEAGRSADHLERAREELAASVAEQRRVEGRLERLEKYLGGLARTPRYARIAFEVSDDARWCGSDRSASETSFQVTWTLGDPVLRAGKCRCVVDAALARPGVPACGALAQGGSAASTPEAAPPPVADGGPAAREPPDRPVGTETRPPASPQAITATLPLSDLVDDRVVRSEFDVFLLTRQDGRVVYAAGNGAGHVEGLGESVAALLEGDGQGKGDADGAGNGGAERSLRSFVEPIEVAGSQYLAYVHPVRVPLRDAATAQRPLWYTLGLIRKDRFLSEARTIPMTVWSIFVGGLMLGVLAWPWLRVWLISRHDELRRMDGFLLGGSALVGAALVTIGLLDVLVVLKTRQEIDHTLERIAAEMAENFDEELADAVSRLRSAETDLACIRAEVSGRHDVDSCAGLDPVTRQALEALAQEVKEGGRPALAVSRDWAGTKKHPIYDVAFRLDPDGVQFGPQLTNRSLSVVKIAVPGRPYFRRARDGPLWPVKNRDEIDDRVFLDRIETYDHGWPLTVVSAAARHQPHEPEVAAVVMGRRLSSFWEVVLPLGFGFVVVDLESGRSLYHADAGRGLVENLLVEVGGDPELASLLESERAGHATARYRGDAHRFYVKPLGALPLRLVVFDNLDTFEAINLDVLMTAGAMTFLYLLLLQLALGVASRLTRDVPWSWGWPRPECGARYRRAALTLAVAVVLLGILALHSSGWSLLCLIAGTSLTTLPFLYLVCVAGPKRGVRGRGWLAVVALVPGLALLVSAAFPFALRGPTEAGIVLVLGGALAALGRSALRLPRSSVQRQRLAPRDRIAYVGAATGALLLMATVPAAGIFRDALEVHQDRATKQNQLHVHEALRRRNAEIQLDAARLEPAVFGGSNPKEQVELPMGMRCRGVHYGERFLSASAPTSPLWDADTSPDDRCPRPAPIRACESAGEAPREAEALDVTLAFARLLPHYSHASTETRQGLYAGADSGARFWRGGRGSLAPDPEAPDRITFCAASGSGSAAGWRGLPLGFPFPEGLGEWTLVGLLFLGAIVVLLLIVRSGAVRVLGLDVEDAPREEAPRLDAEFFDRNRLLIRPPDAFMDDLLDRARRVIDVDGLQAEARVSLGESEGAGPSHSPLLLMRGKSGRSVLLVRDLTDLVIDAAYRRDLLEYLESKAEDPTTCIVIRSEVSPLYRILHPQAYPELEALEEPPSPQECLRWTRLLGRLHKHRFPPVAWEPGVCRYRALLLAECGWSATLQELVDLEVVRQCATEEQVLAHVRDVGSPFYQRVWLHLTLEERLVLIQLADGALANPRNMDVLRNLLRRRLVRRAPDFRLASESFARFVREAEPRARVRAWQKRVGSSSWPTVRLVLIAVLLLAGGMVAYSSKEGLTAMVGIVPAVAGAVPLLLKALDSLQSGKGSA